MFASSDKYRVFGSNDIARREQVVNGTLYHAQPGEFIDTNRDDASILQANGWSMIGPSGTRPKNPSRGDVFISATGPIFWDGATWRTYDGTEV